MSASKQNKPAASRRLRASTPWVLSALTLSVLALVAESAQAQTAAADAPTQITVTGTRIKSLALVATSPVSQVSSETIGLLRAATVEDFSTKLPQLAGGVSSTSAGSDAFGAQTLDLRNLGQSRTLVLINGTRAVPFSIRNAVDVNFIPATLIKRVDVLTGGAAAVYGADAVAGVVNFVMKDSFDGVQVQSSFRSGDGGGQQYGFNITGGTKLGDKGDVVGYVEYTERKGLLAGERSWALANATPLSSRGGNFTDVASGRTFSYDDAGNFGTALGQKTDYTAQTLLVMPLERLNASLFFNYDLVGSAQAYGRLMYANVKTTGAPRSGQAPATVNAVYDINASNTAIPANVRSQLTFVNGVAKVNIDRSLGELGVKTALNDRDTTQFQLGVRGSISAALGWDVYAQTGTSTESIVVSGDGAKANFASAINKTNIFGAGADLSSVAQPFKYGDRKRTQTVVAANVSGDSSDFFKLPAGPIGMALGIERRNESGTFDYNPNLGQSFNQGVESAPPVPPRQSAKEIYGELLVPVLGNLPGVKNLSLEGAYRRSSYDKSVGASNTYGTNKLGLSWALVDDFRLRATQQSVIREPNFGEFANPVFSIPFNSLVTVPRLQVRYGGDPCVPGATAVAGNAEQCQRQGYKAPYNSKDATLLTGGYFFGGNPDIRAEKGTTKTFGFVLTPAFVPGFSLTLDYYNIELKDAVGQIQPIDALTSCYITDPSANNPLCAAVTRDPTTGRIKDGFPVDRNLALIKQAGFDIDASYRQKAPFGLTGHRATFQYQAALVKNYSIQKTPIQDPIDCKGTYGARCSSDAVSLVAPAYRHRVALGWAVDDYSAQLGWKRIGGVRDSTLGSDGTISAQNYFDLNTSLATPIKGLTVNLGIDNLFAKAPPLPKNASSFNTFIDTYNVQGRTYGLSATLKF
jgi:iron complex outermembrane recepter protein